MGDIRQDAARYYDLNPNIPDDVSFYIDRLPSSEATVLELGCGTGRVLLPLLAHCRFIFGLDISEGMIFGCRERLREHGASHDEARVQVGDITSFILDRQFDYIIAPFRVLQNIEDDEHVDGLFQCIRTHLTPGGRCILNAFNPKLDPDSMREHWCTDEEILSWELPFEDGRVTCHDRRPQIDKERPVIYPELVYRRYRGEELVDEVVLRIPMRYYYPDEFQNLIECHGFQVLEKWGGYHGEAYGEGSELVIKFGSNT